MKNKFLIMCLVILFIILIFQGFYLVWIKTSKTEIAYKIKKDHSELIIQNTLRAKLEVERNNLRSPGYLNSQAAAFGLHEPKLGQIRRIQFNVTK